MTNDRSPEDGKLFVVPRTHALAKHPAQVSKPMLRLADEALITLTVIFFSVVGFAGYACLYGDWQRAKDFLLIFLPPMTALMGAVFGASSRS